jgi:hypothetical protein
MLAVRYVLRPNTVSRKVKPPETGRSNTDAVLVHREENPVVLEPAGDWPEGYVASFAGVPDDFERPAQDSARSLS